MEALRATPAPKYPPVLVLGDAPNSTSGLARIARDLTGILYGMGIKVGQLGFGYDGSPWPWPCYPVQDGEQWARGDLLRTWDWHCGGEDGVLLTVWDPSRCFETAGVQLPGLGSQRWGYFAVDSYSAVGEWLSGPAAEALKVYHRVLGYGAWGARILKNTLKSQKPVQWLPHGIDTQVFRPRGQRRRYVGIVATNQHRKDWGGAVAAAAETGMPLWAHIDSLIGPAWSLPQLLEDYGFGATNCVVTQGGLIDDALAEMYSRCLVTIAPGLGEGFGYPVAESLACGTPVIHGDFGGGAELVPTQEWLVEPHSMRQESCYNVYRPVYRPGSVSGAAECAAEWMRREEKVVEGYCRGAVAALDWQALGPRWLSWFRAGFKGMGVEA